MNDYPLIHFCERLNQVPSYRELIPYTPRVTLKGAEDPVRQVVWAALAEHAAKNRPMPHEVWIWGNHVFIPAFEPLEAKDEN